MKITGKYGTEELIQSIKIGKATDATDPIVVMYSSRFYMQQHITAGSSFTKNRCEINYK